MNLRRTIIALSLAAAPILAHAQVFKCVQNGKTVFSGSPCGTNAVAVHTGEESAEEKQRLRDEARGRADAARASSDAANAVRAQNKQTTIIINTAPTPRRETKQEYCDKLLKTAKSAKDEAAMYRYHQGLIDDAKRRQKEAEDEHFSNCYGQNF